ncbi:TPA: mechanosensitive ion channel family protein [Klebsiella michiganensis]|nr:mechanosensitive ion channel family protein [Klebsiella michiganensis]
MTMGLSDKASTSEQVLIQRRSHLVSQLAVLGPEPGEKSILKETPEVTKKRHLLTNQKKTMDEQIRQASAIKNGALTLSTQIVDLRRELLKMQLTRNFGSILGVHFWNNWIQSNLRDSAKVSQFRAELVSTAKLSWEEKFRSGTVTWFLTALIVVTVGRRYSEEFLAWFSINKLPEGRLRRSFLAVAVTLTTLVTLFLTLNSLNLAFTRHEMVSDDVRDFADKLVQLSVFCGLIAGLGRAFLSTSRPSWRLPGITDEIARSLRPYPLIMAGMVFLFQSVEIFNNSAGTSLATAMLAYGVTALFIGVMALTASLRWNNVRRKMTQTGHSPETKQMIAGLINIAITLTGVVILGALLIGYVSFARFLSYELVWSGIILLSYYFLSFLVSDACESLLSINSNTGKRIQNSLNVSERHLSQTAALLSAIGKTALMLLAVSALLNGTINSSTPVELLQKAVDFWGGRGFSSLNIVPSHLVNSLLCLMIGIYALRTVRNWLDREFLPRTTMDIGMRVSLLTLLSNVGYVIIILLALSIMGLQWNKLAWIVSALSVGIGFGLQEIVKNFISGLILLTERPVKVGDLISISGIEGDIRRINVRATEIQLGDKSTVIVPNSQLISQNVRNVTMGNAQGVVSISLTLPLDIDPECVKDILMGVYNQNEYILDNPAPSVSFKDLMPTGIVLSVTGNVISQRYVGGVKSDLLFNILKSLRNEGISLSSPQIMIIERKAGVKIKQD